MSSDEQCWMVRAEWANSGPTYHGLFSYYEHAEAWARDQLDAAAACTGYELGVLTPAGGSTFSDALPRPVRSPDSDRCPGGRG